MGKTLAWLLLNRLSAHVSATGIIPESQAQLKTNCTTSGARCNLQIQDRSHQLRLWLVARCDRSWFWQLVLDLQRGPDATFVTCQLQEKHKEQQSPTVTTADLANWEVPRKILVKIGCPQIHHCRVVRSFYDDMSAHMPDNGSIFTIHCNQVSISFVTYRLCATVYGRAKTHAVQICTNGVLNLVKLLDIHRQFYAYFGELSITGMKIQVNIVNMNPCESPCIRMQGDS